MDGSKKIEAMQFNDLESFWKIIEWMKECGDAAAIAQEVKYTTNIMTFPGAFMFECVRPGEWVMRNERNEFCVARIERA